MGSCLTLQDDSYVLPPPIGQELCAKRNEHFVRAKVYTKLSTKPPLPPPLDKVKIWNCPPPLPHQRGEDFDILGDLENFTIASTRTPPARSGKVKIWIF